MFGQEKSADIKTNQMKELCKERALKSSLR